MADKTPEELEAEIRAQEDREDEALREKVRKARHDSGKEPFDFERLRELYEAIAVPPRATLSSSESEFLERCYYLLWDKVKTLQQAAEFIRWLTLNDST